MTTRRRPALSRLRGHDQKNEPTVPEPSLPDQPNLPEPIGPEPIVPASVFVREPTRTGESTRG
ncbi:hypothetical protein BL254_03025 [Protofrankia sp. BMG5.30]|uniref:Uncharacterized protein n=1 Tax=Protofrankia coriariae TaxID=1562887 RepID=A0ABR5F6A5_9ACTN|nr:hypothetical protein FrCorBMG51_05740 [Protofrankia coriariae]ONH37854.1 hypothetical protein BL254_03025 [Protofrankia sp. BMG5.30]